MAFFKFRQRGQPQPQPEPAGRSRGKAAATETAQESIDSVRRRARHRLVGAAVLVLLAVIGFPLLFDTQPRPVVVDAPITIPDKDKTAPLRIPAPVPASASLDEREEVVSAAPPAA
ncbi:MAG TPA: SPOR domain-containing protein, partial [Ottowia sp.]|nr:SPOR domain-containing protein [Ottowia sp.]